MYGATVGTDVADPQPLKRFARVTKQIRGLRADVDDGSGVPVVHEDRVFGSVEDLAVALLGAGAFDLGRGAGREDLQQRLGQRLVGERGAVERDNYAHLLAGR